jgi:hypothetical protein
MYVPQDHAQQEEECPLDIVPALQRAYERAKLLPKEQQEELANVIELEIAELTSEERPYSQAWLAGLEEALAEVERGEGHFYGSTEEFLAALEALPGTETTPAEESPH